VEINNKHIKEAEQILIDGKEFDKERLNFIKELDSCDLLAVPGSGKTTALLTKLYCLSRYLPFDNDAGILILSHTNAAVEEIEKKLRPFCPKLFDYPNFIGTIQSFIDNFLAIPYYNFYNASKICRIDDVFYNKEIEYCLSTQHEGEMAYFKQRNPNIFYNARFRLNTEGKFDIIDRTSRNLLTFQTPMKWKRDETELDKINKIKSFIRTTKIEILKKGILCYDDCYFLADNYLYKYPKIADYLQQRFQYIFIDEMQDLEKFQIEIIDKVFLSENSPTIIQRIGDINQAIYSSSKKVKVEADWQPRNPVMYMNGSNRLTSEVAGIVNFFTLDRQKNEKGKPRFVVNGLRKLNTTIKPHLVIFNSETKGQLKSTFEEIIRSFSLYETKEGQKYGFKIIGWSAKWDKDEQHDNKLRLENIFQDYKKEKTDNKESLDSLSKYLQYWDRKKKALEPVRNSILNALVHILRIEEKKYTAIVRGRESERYYTKRELFKTIQPIDYEIFKAKVYEWSFNLATKENYSDVYDSIKNFIKQEFKEWFNLSINSEIDDFLGAKFENISVNKNDNKNEISTNDVMIDICTVHSVKGQTHCATMYVETAYHEYETDKYKIVKSKATKTKPEEQLPNPLFGMEHSFRKDKDKRAKEAMKMMYVGFSRPTHLLCFAVLKENVKDDVQKFIDAGWEIIDITV
jgi:hypothetical protein